MSPVAAAARAAPQIECVVNTPPALRWQMARCRSGGCTLVIRRLYSADQEAVLGSSDKR